MPDLLLKVRGLKGGYGAQDVIKDISFDVKNGEFLGIIGPNGSGKSTLLRLLSRALPLKGGDIELESKDTKKIHIKEFCKKVAFVSQDVTINFPFTSGEIALMGRIPHMGRLQFETKKDHSIACDSLSLTDALHLKDKYITELSAGERQRVVIAKALAQEPILLFLDEPTSHLDISHQIQILDLLKKLNRENGLTIIIVLHDLNLASEYCSRIMLLEDGRIFKDAAPKDILTYQNIEAVYKTVVVVNENPISHKPYIVLVSGESICRKR
ncbi:MAG: ABC transporter ATP-binding protein [Candidatus Omnitrophica bacterium]|nr:ABC transporter ATP-binding protein [Candidatus Omnitrophota bacterium]